MYLSPNFGTVLAVSILAIKEKNINFETVIKANEGLTLSHCIYCYKDMHIMETAILRNLETLFNYTRFKYWNVTKIFHNSFFLSKQEKKIACC